MQNGSGFAVPDRVGMRRPRIGPALLAAALLAGLAFCVVPRGFEASLLLAIADDPAQLAERALDGKFTADVARREIDAALAAKDADLANSFIELAAARQVALDPVTRDKVKAAVEEAASTRHAAQSFAQGLVTGEPSNMAGFAGTALGDLFVFGDIRDLTREGARMANGENADELVLGLACVGLAVTAGTYVTLGAAAPARIGLSLAKVARKTGQLGADLASSTGRMMRRMVDWDAMRRALSLVSITEPQVAIRAVREAVKVEKAGGLMTFARDVGRVQAKAGTQAALDGLKIAETPREMARVAKLAEKEGGKTRAIIKLVGRAAIALAVAAYDLAMWILGALLSLVAFVVSLKHMTERVTWRYLQHRKRSRAERYAAMAA